MSNLFLKQTFLFSSSKLKATLRENKLKLFLGVLGIVYIALVYGVMLAGVFLFGIHNTIDQINSSGITSINIYNLLPRDLFVNFILVVFLTILLPELIKGVVGLNNPFVNDTTDVNLQLLIPVNPFVSYFSSKIKLTSRNLILSSIIMFFFIAPLMFVLKVSFIRIFLIILNVFLTLELITLIGDILFFLFNKIRVGKDWDVLVADKYNMITNGSAWVFPILFLQLLSSHLFLTFQDYSNFYYIPFINTAVSTTGLLFRSGIPLVSYLGSLSLLVEVLLLLFIVLALIHFNQTTTEFGDLLPILDFLYTKQRKLFLTIDDNPITTDVSKVEESSYFNYKNSFFSLIKKELLIFSRNTSSKSNYLFAMFCSVLMVFLLFLHVDFSSNSFFILAGAAMYLIVFTLDNMVNLFYSISLNNELLHIDQNTNIKIKFTITTILSIPILLLLLFKLSIFVFVLIIILGFVSELLNRWHLRNFLVIMILGIFIGLIFLNIFLSF